MAVPVPNWVRPSPVVGHIRLALRAECERSARASVGDLAYETAYGRGLSQDRAAGPAEALPGPMH